MEIRDVIGALRERDLEQQREIHALRLDIHIHNYRLDELEGVIRSLTGQVTPVSRETNTIGEELRDGTAQDPLPGL